MTKLLEKAFAQAARLPAGDQDAFAEFVLAELQSEARWARAREAPSGKRRSPPRG